MFAAFVACILITESVFFQVFLFIVFFCCSLYFLLSRFVLCVWWKLINYSWRTTLATSLLCISLFLAVPMLFKVFCFLRYPCFSRCFLLYVVFSFIMVCSVIWCSLVNYSWQARCQRSPMEGTILWVWERSCFKVALNNFGVHITAKASVEVLKTWYFSYCAFWSTGQWGV